MHALSGSEVQSEIGRARASGGLVTALCGGCRADYSLTLLGLHPWPYDPSGLGAEHTDHMETTMSTPEFIVEGDKVGLGWCVIATWLDGSREVVTGFGDEAQAHRWIEVDSARWLEHPPRTE